jgi:hypothetical protein
MLESGGSLTFAQHMRQQEAAAASAAATAAAPLTPPAHGPSGNSSTSQQAYSSSALADALSAGDPAGRIMSAPPVSSAAGLSPAQTGQLNEDIFSGELGGVGKGGSDARSRTQSVTLGAMSRGKRLWQNAAQKIVAMHHITSSYRPGALQVGICACAWLHMCPGSACEDHIHVRAGCLTNSAAGCCCCPGSRTGPRNPKYWLETLLDYHNHGYCADVCLAVVGPGCEAALLRQLVLSTAL